MSLGGFHYYNAAPFATRGAFYTAVLALPNLRFYYPLDELSGTTAFDAGPNGYDATYNGTPTLGVSGATSDGRTGVTFNGTDQWVQATDSASVLDLGTSDWSIGMFMWESSWPADTRHLCTRGDGSGAGSWKFEFRQVSTANTFQPRVGAVTCSSGTGTKNDSAWHLVGYTADRDANLQHYLDGSTDGSGTSIAAESANSYNHTGDLYLARRSSGSYASVSLQHVFMCASALSAGDWAALWAAK